MKPKRIAVLCALFGAFALEGCSTENNPVLPNPKSPEETQADVQNPFGVKQKVRGKAKEPTDVR